MLLLRMLLRILLATGSTYAVGTDPGNQDPGSTIAWNAAPSAYAVNYDVGNEAGSIESFGNSIICESVGSTGAYGKAPFYSLGNTSIDGPSTGDAVNPVPYAAWIDLIEGLPGWAKVQRLVGSYRFPTGWVIFTTALTFFF